MRPRSWLLALLLLSLLAPLPLALAPAGHATAAIPHAPAPFALASGEGTFERPGFCVSAATFTVEVGQGVGTLRWVAPDCPDPTGSANFALVCDTDCDLPPYCRGTPVMQRCEYRLEDSTESMRMTLTRNGAFRFEADLAYIVVDASGDLDVHAWPVV